MEILASSFVYEALVETYAFELPQLLVVERADAQVANALAGPALPFVPLGSKAPTMSCHNSRIGTLVRRVCVTPPMYLTGIPNWHNDPHGSEGPEEVCSEESVCLL